MPRWSWPARPVGVRLGKPWWWKPWRKPWFKKKANMGKTSVGLQNKKESMFFDFNEVQTVYLDLPRCAEWMIRGPYTPSLGFKQHPLEDAGRYSKMIENIPYYSSGVRFQLIWRDMRRKCCTNGAFFFWKTSCWKSENDTREDNYSQDKQQKKCAERILQTVPSVHIINLFPHFICFLKKKISKNKEYPPGNWIHISPFLKAYLESMMFRTSRLVGSQCTSHFASLPLSCGAFVQPKTRRFFGAALEFGTTVFCWAFDDYPPGDGYISHQTGKGKSSSNMPFWGGFRKEWVSLFPPSLSIKK